MNVFDMLADAVRRRGDRIAVQHGRHSLTYRQLASASAAFALWLGEKGCEKGARVLLFSGNCLEYPVFMLGTFHAGMSIVPVNAKLHVREVAYIAGDCRPAVIICRREIQEPLRAAMADAGDTIFLAVEDFDLTAAAAAPADTKAAEVEPDALAWLFYTSGTTGRPKGAMLTHRNLIAAAVNCLADIFPFSERDTVLHVAPLSHGSGLYLIPSLARGARNIISDLPSFQPDAVLDLVEVEDVSVVAFMAPTMIVRLLDAAPRGPLALKGIIYGGAPIHLEHIRAAVARFGPIFVQLYGQGEAPMTISYLPAIDHLNGDDELLLSAGFVRSGVEIRIIDESGKDVADGAEGEIVVRGDVVMKGYWNNPQGTQAALENGWLHTGDFGRFDRDGRLRVLDRRHDTIISGGTNIYPKEIEDVVATHPAIREVIAFGVPDEEWGESVAIAVVAEKGAAVSPGELTDFCRQHLASFKKPKRVHFVEELPKNAYGKVLRRELREQFASAGDAAF